jgi:site-specific DNA recombinase
MMLAFYRAAPEVENDRRALNTFHGMRRAKKEGRYLGIAPTGYINRTSEAGKKYIEPQEPQASIRNGLLRHWQKAVSMPNRFTKWLKKRA